MQSDVRAPKIHTKIQKTMTVVGPSLSVIAYFISILDPNEKTSPMKLAIIKKTQLKVVSFNGKAISTEYQYHTNKFGQRKNPKTIHIILMKCV